MPTEIVATAQATLWNPTPTGARRRLGFLDVSRAIAVLAMLCANLVNVFLRRVPSPLEAMVAFAEEEAARSSRVLSRSPR